MSALGHNRKYSIRAQNVRFTPESGTQRKPSPCPLSTTSGHAPFRPIAWLMYLNLRAGPAGRAEVGGHPTGEGKARMKRRPKDTKSGVAVVSGAQIRAARGFLCWDQRDLAMMAGVPLFAVERIETGEKI